MQIDVLYHARAVLGEGPFWNPTEKRLYWLDIEGKTLHRFDPARRFDEIFPLKSPVGCAVPLESDGKPGEHSRLLIAAENGVKEIVLPFPTEEFSEKQPTESGPVEIGGQNIPSHTTVCRSILSERFCVHPDADRPDNRYNDGKCSPEGRFWFGSLSRIRQKGAASLFVWDSLQTDAARTVIADATNSNGLGWSPDGTVFYWTDTPTLTVFAFDYDPSNGTLSNRRIACSFPDAPGFGRPDGLTVDAEGMLWTAHWMGAAISRWNPRTGTLLEKYAIPVSRVTSLTFGGENLDVLYITTARKEETSEEAASQPYAGDLFVAHPDVRGLSVNFFRRSVVRNNCRSEPPLFV